MLHLQRASAGSGKTYTLTKHFIRHLIARTANGKAESLRTAEEIEDAVRHILAITFTNKATNEMKKRIVDSLSELADVSRGSDTVYLMDFIKELNESEDNIRDACRTALEAVLNNYSDFHVQTIDSFFQSVLRTFAYETDLNDSYQVEIDDDYVARIGIDATIDQLSEKDPDPEVNYWIERLMSEAVENGSHWNVFSKKTSNGSIYARLVDIWHKMQKEGFKKVWPELKKYFEEYPDYSNTFNTMDQAIYSKVKKASAKAKDAAKKLQYIIRQAGIDPKTECVAHFATHIEKTIQQSDFTVFPGFKYAKIASSLMEPNGVIHKKNGKRLSGDIQLVENLRQEAIKMYDALEEWENSLAEEQTVLWKTYRKNMLYMGLMIAIANNSKRILEESNLIEISDTNSLLRRVIGDDETPFIYERLGTTLNHYLIDEFQDTSAMQWDNLRPLIMESESRGEDNLIIGDAKQSIYRFRNADASLITSVVPQEFPNHKASGYSKEDNSNHRSYKNIVEFNNAFFSLLTAELDRSGLYRLNFTELYSNVVQYPAKQENRGYVEINFLKDIPKDAEPDFKFKGMGELVKKLLTRGYRQKDIAFLMKTNQDGMDLIDSLIKFNSNLSEHDTPIDFVSQQSLLVANSEAVKIILAVFEMIANGYDMADNDKEKKKSIRINESDLNSNYRYFASRHPEMNIVECLREFTHSGKDNNSIGDMLSRMQSVTLPALTEAICDAFINQSLKKREAAYIAAFQDAVLDYCKNYAADTASFLKWWEKHSSSLSISSPEDTDAVKIMTIHKAKGLEFKCVVLPWLDMKIAPKIKNTDWLWVKPKLQPPVGIKLPPYIPISLDASLKDSVYSDEYFKSADADTMDRLNSLYVAFTRPIDELYVFTPLKYDRYSKQLSPQYASTYLYELLNKIPGIECDLQNMIFKFGLPTTPSNDNKQNSVAHRNIDTYYVNSTADILCFREESMTKIQDDDTDPRSVGNLMHSIMSMIDTYDDLPKAIRKLRISGSLSASKASEIETILSNAFKNQKAKDWFSPNIKNIRERDILCAGKDTKRPDRIIMTPENKAIVIDYKFGFQDDNRFKAKCREHKRQVAGYMRLLAESGNFSSVEGYVWYIYRNRIDRVI